MRDSFQAMAQREINAGNSFVASVIEAFGTTREQAEKVLLVFRKAKAVKLQRAIGVYNLTHGAFWDRDVIERAIATAE